MRPLGVVRAAGDGDLLVREPEVVRGAGEQEREGLKRLRRGAGVDVAVRVPDGVEDSAGRVTGRDAAPVDALDDGAAPEGDERLVFREPGEVPG